MIRLPLLTSTCLKSTVETLEKGVQASSKLTLKTPERRPVNVSWEPFKAWCPLKKKHILKPAAFSFA